MFLDADSRRAADRIEAIFPQSRDLVRLRTKYFDDHLDACAVAQFRQVVILGAGLDTRAVRKGGSALRFFEIDDVATLELKRSAYRRRAVHVDAIFIPGNYLTDGLVPLLAASGFDFELPTCFIWEGNTMYHAIEDVADLLATVRDRVRRFRIAFDYLSDAVIDKTTGDAGVTRLVEGFEAMGAPWRSGIRDLPAFARELKLRVVNDLRTAELYRRYWQGAADDVADLRLLLGLHAGAVARRRPAVSGDGDSCSERACADSSHGSEPHTTRTVVGDLVLRLPDFRQQHRVIGGFHPSFAGDLETLENPDRVLRVLHEQHALAAALLPHRDCGHVRGRRASAMPAISSAWRASGCNRA
jgi:methyltransferase (TIGR00027 family)